MKKLLSIISIFGLSATTSALSFNVVSCSEDQNNVSAKGVNLESIISVKVIGGVDSDSDSDILNKINQKNSLTEDGKNIYTKALSEKSVNITVDKTNNQATILAKEGSGYSGQITVSYGVRTDLDSVIIKRDLGGNNTVYSNAWLIQQLINNNSGLLISENDVFISNITSTSATLTASSNSDLYKGSVVLAYQCKIDLKEILSITNIGYIKNNTDENILSVINELNNTALTSDDVTITAGTGTVEHPAVISGKVNDYYNDANITYTLQIDINDVITSKLIGKVDGTSNSVLPTEEQIIERINKFNGLSLTEDDIDITNITLNGATITSKDNSLYYGSIDITFVSNINLESLITNKDFGDLGTLTNLNDISSAIISKINSDFVNDSMPELTKNDINAISLGKLKTTCNDDGTVSWSSVQLTANENSTNYAGETSISFVTHKKDITDKLSGKKIAVSISNTGEYYVIRTLLSGCLNGTNIDSGDISAVKTSDGNYWTITIKNSDLYYIGSGDVKIEG